MKKFLNKLRSVSLRDFFHIVLFLLAIIPSVFLKLRHPKLWLVCEYGKEARENGYYFYKYVCENHPEQEIIYAIEPQSIDASRLKGLGKVISYGTLEHWIYYLAADVNISSHKGGKPNAAVCYFLEVYGFLKNKRVFLQHGITKDKSDIFVYKNTKFRLFICGAEPEYRFVRDTFGYPDDYVKYTGFARFDGLHDKRDVKRQILVAPTWRAWLRTSSSDPYDEKANDGIEKSYYYRCWKEFLQSYELGKVLEINNFDLIFYPHRNVKNCFSDVIPVSNKIRIADFQDSDLQMLMKESSLMITDYSSAVMDFAYMNKPVIYYQFDYNMYREKHFEEGYYNYLIDGFGPVCVILEDLILTITQNLENGCEVATNYKERVCNFYSIHDNQNCKRIYDEVKKL